MKVLLLSDYPLPNGQIIGGVPRAVQGWVPLLCELDSSLEVHVLTLTSNINVSVSTMGGRFTIHYVPFALVNHSIIAPTMLAHKLVNKEISKVNPDILHVQGISKYFAVPAIRQKRIPAIITVNGVIHQESKTWTGILGRYRGISGRHLEKYILQQTEHLVAISPYVENAIKAFTHGNISVIYCPVDDKFHNVEKREAAHRILFVGGIEQRKGLHVLIEAVRIVKQHIPDVTLHIVGGIRKKGYFKFIDEKTKAYGLLENVIFRDMITDEELLTEYSEAGVFVLPSQEESLGIVLLEAMATGTPVIASNIGGIPYVVKDGLNGYLVRFGDHEKMAEYIVTLLLNEESRRKLGGIGKEMANQYQPMKIAKSHLQLYRRVLGMGA